MRTGRTAPSVLAVSLVAGALTLPPSPAAAGQPVPQGIDLPWVSRLADPAASASVTDRLVILLSGLARASSQTPRDEVCGCSFDASGRILDVPTCPVVFRTGSEAQAKVAALTLLPAEAWASHFACYAQGSPECRDRRGFNVRGDTCCHMVQPLFGKIEGDLNASVLVPEPVVEALAGFSFAGVADAPAAEALRVLDPSCSIAVDDGAKTFLLSKGWAGFVARLRLYAARHDGARLPEPVSSLALRSASSPPSPAEAARALAVGRLQGGRIQDSTVSPPEDAR